MQGPRKWVWVRRGAILKKIIEDWIYRIGLPVKVESEGQ